MPIQIELPDDFFSADQKEKLKELFKIETNSEFQVKVQQVARAALSEYMEMFLGMGLPSRADEIQQHRLFFLIQHYFQETIPSETEVSSHFQLTRSRSRSLIRSVMTRYHYQLEQQLKNTLKESLTFKIDDPNDDSLYQLRIKSDNVVDQLNIILEREAPELDRIRKVPTTGRMYRVSKTSYEKLKTVLGI